MCEVICPYKDKCTSYPHCCKTCAHNIGKRDYYKSDTETTPVYVPNTWYWYPLQAGTSSTNEQFLVQWR